jgi:hypothetical protein
MYLGLLIGAKLGAPTASVTTLYPERVGQRTRIRFSQPDWARRALGLMRALSVRFGPLGYQFALEEVMSWLTDQ